MVKAYSEPKRPRTLVKVAVTGEQDIMRLAKQYSPDFRIMQAGLREVRKISLIGEVEGNPYWLIISQRDEIHPLYGCDTLMTLISDSNKVFKKIPGELEAKTGIDFRGAPKTIRKRMQFLSLLFPLLKARREGMYTLLNEMDQIARAHEM